jgi:hypothetical protein
LGLDDGPDRSTFFGLPCGTEALNRDLPNPLVEMVAHSHAFAVEFRLKKLQSWLWARRAMVLYTPVCVLFAGLIIGTIYKRREHEGRLRAGPLIPAEVLSVLPGKLAQVELLFTHPNKSGDPVCRTTMRLENNHTYYVGEIIKIAPRHGSCGDVAVLP